jgi:DNA-binding LacI/PurR family transcriptional regulator
VTKETEKRIIDAVRVLGYRPNLIARSMRQQRTHLIGYSWQPSQPGLPNPILDQFLQSMVSAAENAGYHLLAFPHQHGQAWVNAYQDLIATHRVDGFILSSIDFNDPRIQFLIARDFPFVAFGRSNPEMSFPYVDVDGGDGMRQVIVHLASLGHQRIAVLAWPEDSRVGQNRMQGLIAGMQSCGLSLDSDLLLRGEGSYQFGKSAAAQLFQLPADCRPTAIVAFNDVMAIGAIHAAQEFGLQAGRDIAITGFDDTPMVQYLTPSLTSVTQPVWEVGQIVVSMLLKELEGKPLEESSVLLCPLLTVRESSARAWVNR